MEDKELEDTGNVAYYIHLSYNLEYCCTVFHNTLVKYVKQANRAHNAFSILSGLQCRPKLVLPQGDASFHLTTEDCPFLHSDEEDSHLFQLNGSSSDESGPSTVERSWLQSPAVGPSPLYCGPPIPLNFGELADSDSDIMDDTPSHMPSFHAQ